MRASLHLRRTTHGYGRWCPACESLHKFWTEGAVVWAFDGDMERPPVTPSLRHTNVLKDGPACCHYMLTAGKLIYCPDSTHALANHSVDLPELPVSYR